MDFGNARQPVQKSVDIAIAIYVIALLIIEL